MAALPLPSQAYLRECFDYDPVTGAVIWKKRPAEHFRSRRVWLAWNSAFSGKRCGSPCTRGYLRVKLDNQGYLLHRIIWRWVTGDAPVNVDHVNHLTDDNRWVNLRHATIAENTRHMHGHKDRKYAGSLKGAYRHKAGWLSFIGFNGKQHYLGLFKSEKEAHECYLEAAKLLHGEFMGPIVTEA